MAFHKATIATAHLHLALVGPAGAGKTYSALRVAVALGKRVALIDTERGSSAKYGPRPGERADPNRGTFDFDMMELESFEPKTYVAAIHEAEREGYDVIVVDSLSHAWNAPGGILDQKDRMGGNFDAWRKLTPQHNDLVNTLLTTKAHLIVTMRAKTEYVVEKDERTGKNVPRKVGLAPVQREGLEYEFDVVLDIDPDHVASVSKTRCSALADKTFRCPGPDVANILGAWLGTGPVKPAASKPIAAPAVNHTPLTDFAAMDGRVLLKVGASLQDTDKPAYFARWQDLWLSQDASSRESMARVLRAKLPTLAEEILAAVAEPERQSGEEG